MAFPNEALDELRREFGQRIAERLKSLLESKHLYQSILLEYEDLLDAILKRVTEYPVLVRDQFPKLVQGNWAPVDNAYRGMVHSGQPLGCDLHTTNLI